MIEIKVQRFWVCSTFSYSRFKFLHICYIFPCFKCIRKVYLIVLNDLKNLIGKCLHMKIA